ncbi:MAG: hypothetical protein J5504_00230 [Butyrivibrio sp.]|nr:hypothetical protein [Butyrivibrio sp.]
MSELSKRVVKYYFKQGFKLFAYVLLGIIPLGCVWAFMVYGNDYDWKRQLFRMLFGYCEWLVPYFIFCFSMQAPTWHDSMAMSMGARRKDVFCGNLIKQGTFALCSSFGYILLILWSRQTEQMNHVLFLLAISLASGSVGHFLGYKVYRYGRKVMLISVIAFLITYSVVRVSYTINYYHMAKMFSFEKNIFAYILGFIILFVVMEILIYKANKKCVVIM